MKSRATFITSRKRITQRAAIDSPPLRIRSQRLMRPASGTILPAGPSTATPSLLAAWAVVRLHGHAMTPRALWTGLSGRVPGVERRSAGIRRIVQVPLAARDNVTVGKPAVIADLGAGWAARDVRNVGPEQRRHGLRDGPRALRRAAPRGGLAVAEVTIVRRSLRLLAGQLCRAPPDLAGGRIGHDAQVHEGHGRQSGNREGHEQIVSVLLDFHWKSFLAFFTKRHSPGQDSSRHLRPNPARATNDESSSTMRLLPPVL